MRPLRSLPLSLLGSTLLCASAALAQQFAPAVRIVNPINESQLTTLKGNTHPAANARNDRGPVSPDLPMTDLILVLSRSPEQQAAFDKFVASQYEPGSPDFHHWLEPEEVGANFGPSESDIATISKWLTGHGFSVDEVSKDRMTIRFSGTARQVESAFHTEIHNLEVKGAAHIGNMSDPQIPAALAPVVVGVKALHNFFPKPMHKLGSKVQFNSKTGRWERIASDASTAASGVGGRLSPRPQFGTQDSYGDVIEDVAPYDFAAIYNVLPLWNAANRIDGTGQTIAIVGTSDILPADIATFRSAFGLPAVKSFTTIVANGTDPGQCGVHPTTTCSLGDQIENSLDVEWSGAVAPGADQVLVVSGSNSATTDTVYSSANYIIQNKATVSASILNVSYGECELGEGTTGNVAYYDMWQTAAAEGIAAFVASGDSGSAACDDGMDQVYGTPWAAEYGLSVSGIASSPYDTAVGGTDFNWCPASDLTSNTACKASPYWGTSNSATTQANALGYVPEIPWNDSCASATGIAAAQYLANELSGYGYSTPTPSDAETSCNFYIQNYYLIYELSGGSEDVSGFVDTVGGGGGKSGCVVNSTTGTATGPVSSCVSTTTSTGTANGSIPLVNDGWPKPSWQTNANIPGLPSDGVRDIPDVSFFASNGFNSSAYLICVSEAGSACTYSATSENIYQEVGGTSVSSPAMAGVMALINQKTGVAQGSPNSELYALAAQQTYSSCSAESVTAGSSCYFNDIDEYTNDQPCDYMQLSPNCVASESYEGVTDEIGLLSSGSATEGGYNATRGFDMATGLGSLNVANVVNGWTSLIGTATASVTVTPASSSLQVSTALSVTVTVASVPAGGTTPTGTVVLSGGGYTSPVGTLSSGSYTFTIPAFSLSGGTDTLTANYSGDSTYAQESGTASVTVTKVTATVTVQPSPTTVGASTIVVVGVTVTGTGPTPTGTVQLTGGGYTSGACTLANGACTINIPADSLSNGTDTLTVAYSGDSNYNAASGTATVTVNILTPTVIVTPSATSLYTNQSLTVSGTVSGTGPTPTGTVQLTGGGYTSAAVALSGGSYTITIPVNSLSAGNDTLTVTYSGDAIYTSANKATTVTVTTYVPLIPVVTVTPASSTLDSGSSLIVTGTVSGTGVTPTGTVTLSGGGYTSAAVALSSGGYTITIPGNSLSAGSDTLTVSYSGDINYATGMGTASVAVTQSIYALAATTPGAIAPGGTATSTVTVSSSTVYTGTVTLSCALTTSPSGATDLPSCSGINTTQSVGGTGATFTVYTTAASSELVWPKLGNGKGWAGAGGGAVLAFLVFLGIPARRRSWRSMLGVLAVMAALGSLAGCAGGGGGGNSGTTAGSYIFTVTGTGTPPVTPAPTTTFTVIVN